MKTIYLDVDFKCHIDNAEERVAVITNLFDNVSDFAVPFYRYIPQGSSWTNSKGETFVGDCIMLIEHNDAPYLIGKQKNYDAENSISLEESASLINTIEELCEEIINNG